MENGLEVWKCATCGREVLPMKDDDGNVWPISLYWNKEHNMVFCSAMCSCIMHDQNYVKKDENDD